MARVVDERFSLHRPPKVLRAVRGDDLQAHQDRHRATPGRVVDVTFKQAVENLYRDNPSVSNFLPCFLNQDHTFQEGIAACEESNPFRSTIAYLRC